MEMMPRFIRRSALSICALNVIAIAGTPLAQPVEKNSLDLLSYESNYTGSGRLHNTASSHQDSFYTDFSYDHRFLISGDWYFRTGFEYERFYFGGSKSGLPDHLQSLFAHLAVEYIVQDHAGAGVSLEPGYYFQNRISGDAFDVPWRIWMSFPLKKDTVFGVLGVGGSLYQDPVVAPGGGIIWLISEKMRLEGVFPKPALVYSPNDRWEYRLLGEVVFESFRTDEINVPERNLRLHNAVVQYSEYRGGVQVNYSGFKPFGITLGAGYTFAREFDFFRANQRQRIGGAPYVNVGIEAKF